MKIKKIYKKTMREIVPEDVKIIGGSDLFEKDYDAWKELRNSFIGGSEAGSIIGTNLYANKVDVYMDKVHGSNFDGNESTFQGNRLEEWVASEFISRNPNLEVYRFGYTLKKGNLGANVDYVIRDKKSGAFGILEIKTGSERSLKNWEISHMEEDYTNIAVDVPRAYYAQVVHYLGITSFSYAYIAAFVGNKYIQTPRFEASKEDIMYIMGECEKFWRDHIVPQRPPILAEGDSGTDRLIKTEYSPNDDEVADLEEEVDLVERYFELNEKAKEIDKEMKSIKQQLNIAMENSKTGKVSNYIIKRGTQTRTKLDKDKLFQDLGDKANGFYVSYNINTFSIKKEKGVNNE